MTATNYQITIQHIHVAQPLPDDVQIKQWVSGVLTEQNMPKAELCIRIVSMTESQQLNSQYRQRNKPTNVLAFPMSAPDSVPLDIPLLGDIVICADIIANEARHQNKELTAHWAHIVIHGLLHLLGFDHITKEEAAEMEAYEAQLLKKFGFSNPYEVIHDCS